MTALETTRAAAREYARGDYQDDLLNGRQRISGSDLKGNARKYGGRYAASRAALIGRLEAAGFTVEVKPLKSPSTGRPVDVLIVNGAPLSSRT